MPSAHRRRSVECPDAQKMLSPAPPIATARRKSETQTTSQQSGMADMGRPRVAIPRATHHNSHGAGTADGVPAGDNRLIVPRPKAFKLCRF